MASIEASRIIKSYIGYGNRISGRTAPSFTPSPIGFSKPARYENFQTILGKQRPTRLVMEDAIRKGEKSTLEYSEMKLRDLEDKMFTKDYLKKLE